MHPQTPDEIVMIRPAHFGFDAETADSNVFQHEEAVRRDTSERAVKEFNAVVTSLRQKGVKVQVFDEDEDGDVKPDAVFLNNWFSTHSDGSVYLYPMLGPSRRRERRADIIEYFKKTKRVMEIHDFSSNEVRDQYLEGTGSIVFDHLSRTAYACRSPRTDEELFLRLCQRLQYKPILFTSMDTHKIKIYHTNVMMWIGTRAAAICLDSIKDEKERAMVYSSLTRTPGRSRVFLLSQDEVLGFAGNCLEVSNSAGQVFLVMSKTAAAALGEVKLSDMRQCFDDIIVCDVSHIEAVGGGGIRCMMAGVHLKK